MHQVLQSPHLGRRWPRGDNSYSRRQWSPVRDLQSTTWLKEAYDRLSELEKLDENWDRQGSRRAAGEAVLCVRVLLSNHDMEDIPRPHICALPDGGIGLHWRIGDRDLEIEVEPDASVHYLKTSVASGSMDDGDASSPLGVQDVLDWLIGR